MRRAKSAAAPATTPTTSCKGNTATSSGSRGKPTPTKAEYEVELILKSRQNKKTGTPEYLVKWKGYHVKDNTWEPEQNLTHCAKALKEFCSSGTSK
jgi:hypothetical protein